MFVVDGDESVRLMMSCNQFGPVKSFWEHLLCGTCAQPWLDHGWVKFGPSVLKMASLKNGGLYFRNERGHVRGDEK